MKILSVKKNAFDTFKNQAGSNAFSFASEADVCDVLCLA